jgi:hypothetical protein
MPQSKSNLFGEILERIARSRCKKLVTLHQWLKASNNEVFPLPLGPTRPMSLAVSGMPLTVKSVKRLNFLMFISLSP